MFRPVNGEAGWWFEGRMLDDTAIEQFAGIGGPEDENTNHEIERPS